ncbi:TIGR01244 family sulfur transferase [Microbaculum marinum]
MANIFRMEDGVFVGSQLTEADIDALPAKGFRTLVVNRPDGEADDQMSHDAARAAAQRNGLAFHYQPVESVDATEDWAVAGFRDLLDSVERPALFCCRTGNRSTLMWAQAAVSRLGVDAVIDAAAKAGCDFEPIRDIFEDLARDGGK